MRRYISTHALTEGDTTLKLIYFRVVIFQLTPSRRATREYANIAERTIFQLTPSRRATINLIIISQKQKFQLTPSRRATSKDLQQSSKKEISTHALTEGDDVAEMAVTCCDISTHALTEGDRSLLHTNSLECHFNSRPHGGRPTMIVYPSDDLAFQLTPSRRATFNRRSFLDMPAIFQLTPSRRATRAKIFYRISVDISTHALTEGDRKTTTCRLLPAHFNSRPHGGRHLCKC